MERPTSIREYLIEHVPPEAVIGFARGAYQAVLNGALTGLIVGATGGWGIGFVAAATAALISLGGRTVEGAIDGKGRKR